MLPNIVMTTDPAVGEVGLKGAGTQEEMYTEGSLLRAVPDMATVESFLKI